MADHAAIGRAVERFLEVAWADQTIRAGLIALAEAVAERAGTAFVSPAPPTTEAVLAVLDQAGLTAPLEAAAASAEASTITVVPDAAPAVAGEDDGSPDDGALGRLIDQGLRRLADEQARAAAERAPAAASEQPVDEPGTGTDIDAPLPGIATRGRLRAALARSVAERERSGNPVDDDLIHRARSEGASVWVLDLRGKTADDIDTFAACLDAMADAADLVVLRRRYEPGVRERRQQAVEWVAAAQSALRIATRALRTLADDDQEAAFRWLDTVTSEERIFIARHMRLNDPFDPDRIGEIAGQVAGELESLRARADRDAANAKRLQNLRYLSGQFARGKATDSDRRKVVEVVGGLVDAGVPPTSLDLRNPLLPIRDRLPDADDLPIAYRRVLGAIDAYLERRAEAAEIEMAREGDAERERIRDARQAVERARVELVRVVIPDAAIARIGELAGKAESGNWGRRTWRALAALDAYARAATEGSAAADGFWVWCATSGDPLVWPASPKTLAMRESEFAMQAFGHQRRFEVDPDVDPSGSIEMEAHCKVIEGGGPEIPRLYFHDDTKGVTGRIHVGFIGPHRYVENASTN